MALYDNQHWLLSHIKHSFISTDDTSMCEMVMVGEDIPRLLKSRGLKCYPGMEESDDEDLDVLAESYDIQMDMEFGHRPRSNTAQRLEKMELERKKAAKVKHVKWDQNPGAISLAEQSELFKRKDFRKKDREVQNRHSLLSEQLVKSPLPHANSFNAYARFDGQGQVGVPVRKHRIFMCMFPKEERRYPMQVVVLATAKVHEFIGLICHKYASEHPDHPLKEDISKYGLYITEDEGEVDWDFPCLDHREVISKFEFPDLGLVEMKASDRARHEAVGPPVVQVDEPVKPDNEKEQEEVAEDLARMEGHTTAMEAPIYQSFRVYIINKLRTKTEIHMGISGDKIEIDPVITGKGAGRFWNRQRSASYQMDNIAWCELTENKGPKTTFTIVYTAHASPIDSIVSSSSFSHSLHQSASFKSHDFEADYTTADEIVRKINHILEMRSSISRKEFLAYKERKATRRKSFHLHR